MKNTLNETRLDRIERNLEVFFIGMQELKEFQKRTSEQIMELKESQERTDEQLNRTDKQLQKTIKKLDDIGERLRDMGFVKDEVDE